MDCRVVCHILGKYAQDFQDDIEELARLYQEKNN